MKIGKNRKINNKKMKTNRKNKKINQTKMKIDF